MLSTLHIENIAVIEQAEIAFDSGFNVLTGETGAGKTIVIDYVEHKSKKNEHDRVSAYEEDHHEPIVSREIALAAQMVKKSSRKMTEGVPDFSVIHKGNLKGFVSICPGWGGIDGSALLEICQEVYEEEELEDPDMVRRGTGKSCFHGIIRVSGSTRNLFSK